jgi:AraC-like DNA-binding protein
MTSFRMRRASPPLDAFVALIWTCEREPARWAQERLLPGGSVELVVDLAAPASVDCISGPHSRFFVLDTTMRQRLVGVHFKPGGAFPFVRPPLVELRNAEVTLDGLWGATAREFRERLGEAATDEERFTIVERVLLEQGRGRMRHHPAVAFALREFTRVPHIRTVADVSDAVGLSQRRFIERFSQEVGLTPKVFCRIRRFQRAVRCAHRNRSVNWSEVAVDCGYFDQAHLIHDFQAFSGLTPSAWAAQRTEHVNHVPILD